jgi:hypothetical protein
LEFGVLGEEPKGPMRKLYREPPLVVICTSDSAGSITSEQRGSCLFGDQSASMKPHKRLKGDMRGVGTERKSLCTLWGTGGELVDMKHGYITLNAEKRLKCVLVTMNAFLTTLEAIGKDVSRLRGPFAGHFSYHKSFNKSRDSCKIWSVENQSAIQHITTRK